jgi:hypothetical protein
MSALLIELPDAAPVAAPDVAADPAAGGLVAQVAGLQSRVDVLTRERDELAARLAEQDAPQWTTIKRAAHKVNRTYDRVRRWAAKAILAGRLNEARKDGGAVRVNLTALIKACHQ